ncbi:CoA ester lyase [Metarhizobium album]|uniref:CoA ester lyase n=1 Tax=Metarhizobium album TaxID=2182425 RepID=A0A2U2DNV6_9HYPH|nr:CoA ester lyase [Rhizobium album]PWE54974.1 CoA ester lyase [Rhizobium album]
MTMLPGFADHALFLFVPADRPERFAKAVASGADAVIIDLEDAVPAHAKAGARDGLGLALGDTDRASPIFVRVNGAETAWHDGDVAVIAALPIDGVILPKAEAAADIAALRKRLPEPMPIIAIVESARGLSAVDEIAVAADRLAFGSIDFAADLGCAHNREALLFARSRIVLAARLAKAPTPIDGVTLAIGETTLIEDDMRYGASLGFGGKLLIHPRQIEPARKGLAPGAEDLAWALRIVASVEDGAARAVDGAMVDLPVLTRARQVVRAHQRFSNGS